MEGLDYINAAIMGGVIAIGIFLKDWLKDKKIKNFELKRLLPVFILIVAEVLNVGYGLTIQQNIVISISEGFVSACISVFGYDVVKTVMKKGNKDDA